MLETNVDTEAIAVGKLFEKLLLKNIACNAIAAATLHTATSARMLSAVLTVPYPLLVCVGIINLHSIRAHVYINCFGTVGGIVPLARCSVCKGTGVAMFRHSCDVQNGVGVFNTWLVLW